MNKIKQIIGIDVSKLTLDVYDESYGHSSYSNDVNGFKQILKHYDSNSQNIINYNCHP